MIRRGTRSMPVLMTLSAEFVRTRPFDDIGVLLHMHMTPETVELGRAFAVGGAQVAYLPSNLQPAALDVQRDAASHGSVFESSEQLARLTEHERPASEFYVVEGNGRFAAAIHDLSLDQPFLAAVKGVSEHTSGGGCIVDALDPAFVRVPIVAVYRCALKRDLETGWGTAQSVTAALLRGLGRPIAGRRVGIIGFGAVGQGIARMLRTMGGHVAVADRRKEALLVACLQGFRVGSVRDVLATSDVCLTATGSERVLTADNLVGVKEGFVLANVSNKPNEIDLTGCLRVGERSRHLVEWRTPGGARFFVLGGGLQVNHVVGDGNPAELMDISFALHAVAIRWLVEERPRPGVYPVPDGHREEVAGLALEGVSKTA